MQDTFWTDETVAELIRNRFINLGPKYIEDHIAAFKASKAPKKEWEIAAYRGDIGLGDRVYELCSDGDYRWKGVKDKIPRSAELLVSQGCAIHSVRRLSDGEVFSVGEKVKTPHHGEKAITRFQDHDTWMQAWFDFGNMNMKFVEKLPQPILTTVDGVEVLSGDLIYFIGNNYFIDTLRASVNSFYDENPLCFSTREAAEAYILNHKPLLSLNDVKEACKGTVAIGETFLIEKLTNLVKQKLNQ